MKRVVITGIGVITANANNKDEFEAALYNSRSGIGEVDLFDMSKMRTQLGGQVKKKFGELVNPDDNDERSVLLAKEAMKEALDKANLTIDDIDYVNAHGTATKGNDEMELKAIELLFGDKAKEVAISSTKSMTGHCLGAAGSIELVASIIALEKGFIPATATLNEPQKNYEQFNLVKGKSIKKELNYVLSNSFAFAGNTSSIVIGRYKEQIN